MNVGKIHSLGEVLPEQTVGVFVGAALPGTLWITEVDLDVRVQGEAFVISQFFAAIPGERLVEFTRQLVSLLDECVDHRFGVFAF